MVVRMRHTRAHTKNRRSHHGLTAPTLSTCSHCGEKHRPHHMCLNCGYYNGRKVLDLESEKAKRDARIKAKRERIQSELGTSPEAPQAETAAAPESKESAKKESKPKRTKKSEKESE